MSSIRETAGRFATVTATAMTVSCLFLSVMVYAIATQRMVISTDPIDPALYSALADKAVLAQMEGK